MQDKNERKINSFCSACGHPLQDLTHLLLDCPASGHLRHAIFGTTSLIFDLWSRPWGLARLLGLHGVPPYSHPSGIGEHHHHHHSKDQAGKFACCVLGQGN